MKRGPKLGTSAYIGKISLNGQRNYPDEEGTKELLSSAAHAHTFQRSEELPR